MCDGSFGGKADVASKVRPGSKAVAVELVCVAIFEGGSCCCEELGACGLRMDLSLYGNAGMVQDTPGYIMTARGFSSRRRLRWCSLEFRTSVSPRTEP